MSHIEHNPNVKTGIGMFLIEEYFYKPKAYFFFWPSIPSQYQNHLELSISMLKIRNAMITLSFLEVGSSLLGWSYYLLSKNPLYLIVNLFTLLLSILGIISFTYIISLPMIFYALLTISLPGLFFIHQLFGYCFYQFDSLSIEMNANGIEATPSLCGLFTLPYVFDMTCGLMAVYFMRKLAETDARIMTYDVLLSKVMLGRDEERSLLHKDPETYMTLTKDELQKEFVKRSMMKADPGDNRDINLLCVICLDNTRKVLCEPCKHLLLCEQCMNSLKEAKKISHKMTCPSCRRGIEFFSKIYI